MLAILWGSLWSCSIKLAGGGSIGAAEVAKAKGDGYTLLTGSFGMVTIRPYLANVGYTYESFKPVAQLVDLPLVLAVKKDSPINNIKDFIEYANANNGKIKYGTPGAGTIQHMTMERFSKKQGFKLVHTPFGGSNRSVAELLGGHIEAIFVGSTMVIGQYKANEIKILGITSDKRIEIMPDVPTFKEQGFDVTAGVWFGILAPKDTPDDVVAKLATELKNAGNDPKVADALKKLNLIPAYLGTKEFSERIKKDALSNQEILKEIGMTKS